MDVIIEMSCLLTDSDLKEEIKSIKGRQEITHAFKNSAAPDSILYIANFCNFNMLENEAI